MQELLEKLDELETRRFMLQMADHWTHEDYLYDDRLYEEIRKVKEQLKALGWEGETK